MRRRRSSPFLWQDLLPLLGPFACGPRFLDFFYLQGAGLRLRPYGGTVGFLDQRTGLPQFLRVDLPDRRRRALRLGDRPDHRGVARLHGLDRGPSHHDVPVLCEVLLHGPHHVPVDGGRPAREEGRLVDHGDAVGDVHVPVDVGHTDLVDVDVRDIRAVPSVVAVSIVRFPRGKGHPRHVVPRPHPAHVSRGPVDISPRGRHPEPADVDGEGPAAVMVGSPSPGLIADPDVVSAPPHPPPVPVRGPIGDQDDRGGPAVPVFRHIHPPAAAIEVAGVRPELLRQVPIAFPPGEDDPVPLHVPPLPVVGRGNRR